MNSYHKISVICPLYNTEKYLARCIGSVLNQTYKHFELILVNDCSIDNSGNICLQYAQNEKRIKYIPIGENKGVANARNIGLKNADGDFIAWIDSDDWVDDDWLETMYNLTQCHAADIAIIGTRNRTDDDPIHESQTDRTILEFDTETALTHLVYDRYISSGLMDKLYKSYIFTNITFPVGRTCQDAAVMHILLSRAKKIVSTNIRKYNYFFRLGSLSHDYSIKYEYDRFRAHCDRLDFFFSTNRHELYLQEASIVFIDALKIQEMGMFRKNNDDEKAMIATVFNWIKKFIEKQGKQYISKNLITRFNLIHGSLVNRIYIVIRYELINRLRYFFLTNSPDFFIAIFRIIKKKIY
jgi:glycosyltransferase involved in cell wall biosynthesis